MKSIVPMDVVLPRQHVNDRRLQLAELKADLLEVLLEDPDGPDFDAILHRTAVLLER